MGNKQKGFGGGYYNQDQTGGTYGGTSTWTNYQPNNQSYGSKSGGFHHGGCGHKGQIKIWEGQGIALYGAGTQIEVDDSVKAVIDLAGSARKQIEDFEQPAKPSMAALGNTFMSTKTTPTVREAILAYLGSEAVEATVPQPKAKRQGPPPIYIDLNWPDMSAPKVGFHFWEALWNQLPRGTTEQPAKVQVCCMGGHGRTGTALSALLIVGAGFHWANAINWVRLYHCTSAVETNDQVDYLKDLSRVAGTDHQPLDTKVADELDGVQAAQDAKSNKADKGDKKANGKKASTSGNIPELATPSNTAVWTKAASLMKKLDLTELGKTPSRVLIQPVLTLKANDAGTRPAEDRLAWVPFDEYMKGIYGGATEGANLPDVYGVTFD